MLRQKLQSADDRIIARGEKATEVAEAEAKLKEARLLKKEEKTAQATADSATRYKNTLKFIGDTYGKLPGPVKKAIPFVPKNVLSVKRLSPTEKKRRLF